MNSRQWATLYYGWVIVGVCFLTIAVSYAIRYNFAIFYVAILDEFGWSRADTALVYSINMIVYGGAAPLVGFALDRYGPRKLMTGGAVLLGISSAACSLTSQIWHLLLLYGVFVALGICATGYVPNTSLVSRWFVRNRGKALGLFGIGIGLAYLSLTGVEAMISAWGWRDTYRVMGLLALCIAPVIAIFQRLDPREKGLVPDGEVSGSVASEETKVSAEDLIVDKDWASRDWTIQTAVATRRFWILFVGWIFIWGIGVSLTLTHLVAFAVDQGYSRAFGAWIYGLYGGIFALSNGFGFISDRVGREVAITIGISLAAAGVTMLILNRGNDTVWLMYLFSLLFGTGIGITSPALTASAADIFQGKHFGSIYGTIVLGFGVGGAIGPWLGGLVFDSVGNYIPAFAVVLMVMAGALACFWIAAPRKVRLVPGRAHHYPA